MGRHVCVAERGVRFRHRGAQMTGRDREHCATFAHGRLVVAIEARRRAEPQHDLVCTAHVEARVIDPLATARCRGGEMRLEHHPRVVGVGDRCGAVVVVRVGVGGRLAGESEHAVLRHDVVAQQTVE